MQPHGEVRGDLVDHINLVRIDYCAQPVGHEEHRMLPAPDESIECLLHLHGGGEEDSHGRWVGGWVGRERSRQRGLG